MGTWHTTSLVYFCQQRHFSVVENNNNNETTFERCSKRCLKTICYAPNNVYIGKPHISSAIRKSTALTILKTMRSSPRSVFY